MKNLKVGHYVISLWLIAILLISGIGSGVLAYHVWNALITLHSFFGDNQEYSTWTTIEWRIIGIKAVCPKPGIAESITLRLLLDRASTEPTDPFIVKCALYIEQGDAIVKQAETETRELWEEGKGWYTFNFPDPKPSLESDTYWIVALAQLVPGFPYMYAGGVQGVLLQEVRGFEFPDVLPNPSFFNNSISIYCTYCVAEDYGLPFMIATMIAFVTATLLGVIVHRRNASLCARLSDKSKI